MTAMGIALLYHAVYQLVNIKENIYEYGGIMTMKTDRLSEGLSGRPVIFGEVLYDVFSDGKGVLGGAPFNVAWNLKGFGLDPLFISRVGEDIRGKELEFAMENWEMDMSGLQKDPVKQTGEVEVALAEDGTPSYSIMDDQAYDHIDENAALKATQAIDCSLIYHGSLIARSETSAGTLNSLLANTSVPSFVDANIREPFSDNSMIETSLERAKWAKLNKEELCSILNIKNSQMNYQAESRAFVASYKLDLLCLTLGASGAFLTNAERSLRAKPIYSGVIKDTVGAGDAFTAVVILGLSLGWDKINILQRAIDFSVGVCGIQGAISRDKAFYQSYSAFWTESDV